MSHRAATIYAAIAAGLLLTCVARTALASLPGTVSEALGQAGIPVAAAGIWVQALDAPEPRLRVNDEQPLNPASLIKLVTTFSALSALGPSYRWKTQVYAVGTRAGDVLSGHLILKGTGDPKLTIERIWLLLRELRARGLRQIDGNLILDRSHFEVPAHDPARFDDEPLRPYNVGPDALLVNFKSVRFSFSVSGDRVRITALPRPLSLEIVNALEPVRGSCGDWRSRVQTYFRLPADGRPPRAAFSGRYPVECGERTWNISLFTHREYTGGVFRELWEELGGTWTGQARDGVLPAEATLLAETESESLGAVVQDINKFSNNVMARQLFLTLGAEHSGVPGRTVNAIAAVQATLALNGIAAPDLVIDNGAGLSRRARVSARTLGALLVHAHASGWMPEFIASLPLVGIDGTMRKRLKADPVRGMAHIKTGSLADVKAIAGFVLDRTGRRHAVVAIVNHPNAGRVQPAFDALLRWIHAGAR